MEFFPDASSHPATASSEDSPSPGAGALGCLRATTGGGRHSPLLAPVLPDGCHAGLRGRSSALLARLLGDDHSVLCESSQPGWGVPSGFCIPRKGQALSQPRAASGSSFLGGGHRPLWCLLAAQGTYFPDPRFPALLWALSPPAQPAGRMNTVGFWEGERGKWGLPAWTKKSLGKDHTEIRLVEPQRQGVD